MARFVAAPDVEKPAMKTNEQHRFAAIDGMRGLAALYVVVFHANWQTHIAFSQFIANGYLAVDLFFIISGFVIASAYSNRIADAVSFGCFMLMRLFRIYPLHLAVLLAFVALELARLLIYATRGSVGGPLPFTGDKSLELLTAHFFLLQGLDLTARIGWNAPSWSISCEFFAYLLFGLTVVIMPLRRLPHPALLVGSSVVLYAVIIGGWSTLHAVPLARCIAGFALGVAMFQCRREWDGVIGALPRIWHVALEVAIVVSILASLTLTSGPSAIILIPLFAVAVMLFQARRGPVSSALESNAIQFLGRTSYSIYMVHILTFVPFTFAIKRLTGSADYLLLPDGRLLMIADPWLGDISVLVVVPAVLVVSHFTYLWIEEPGRQLGRRIAARVMSNSSHSAAPIGGPAVRCGSRLEATAVLRES